MLRSKGKRIAALGLEQFRTCTHPCPGCRHTHGFMLRWLVPPVSGNRPGFPRHPGSQKTPCPLGTEVEVNTLEPCRKSWRFQFVGEKQVIQGQEAAWRKGPVAASPCRGLSTQTCRSLSKPQNKVAFPWVITVAQHGHWNRNPECYLIISVLRGQLHPKAALVTGGNGYHPEYHLQHPVHNEQHYHHLFLLDLSVLGSNQLTSDGGLGSTWLKQEKKKKELKALGSRLLVVGIWCTAPPHGNCTNMQGKNESCALASRGEEWHRLFLCKIIAKCHQVRLNLEIRVRCGWNLGVELFLLKAQKSHTGFGCSVSVPCSVLQLGWIVLPTAKATQYFPLSYCLFLYLYLFMNFWEAENLQAQHLLWRNLLLK